MEPANTDASGLADTLQQPLDSVVVPFAPGASCGTPLSPAVVAGRARRTTELELSRLCTSTEFKAWKASQVFAKRRQQASVAYYWGLGLPLLLLAAVVLVSWPGRQSGTGASPACTLLRRQGCSGHATQKPTDLLPVAAAPPPAAQRNTTTSTSAPEWQGPAYAPRTQPPAPSPAAEVARWPLKLLQPARLLNTSVPFSLPTHFSFPLPQSAAPPATLPCQPPAVLDTSPVTAAAPPVYPPLALDYGSVILALVLLAGALLLTLKHLLGFVLGLFGQRQEQPPGPPDVPALQAELCQTQKLLQEASQKQAEACELLAGQSAAVETVREDNFKLDAQLDQVTATLKAVAEAKAATESNLQGARQELAEVAGLYTISEDKCTRVAADLHHVQLQIALLMDDLAPLLGEDDPEAIFADGRSLQQEIYNRLSTIVPPGYHHAAVHKEL